MPSTLEKRAAHSARVSARYHERKAGLLSAQQLAPCAETAPAQPEVVLAQVEQPVAPLATTQPILCPCPLHERPTGEASLTASGLPTVKPFGELIGPAQELVLTAETIATTPLLLQPRTHTELTTELLSLEREAGIIEKRLRQVRAELHTLPTAA